MLFKVKNISKFLKSGYKVLPINIDITVFEEDNDIFIKPMPIWFQLKYYNKSSKMDDDSKYLFGKGLHDGNWIFLQNCKIIVNQNTQIIVIKPVNIWYQFYYLASFGYLRQKTILTEDYTFVHKFIDYLYSKTGNRVNNE